MSAELPARNSRGVYLQSLMQLAQAATIRSAQLPAIHFSERNTMRLNFIAALILATSLSICATTSFAQRGAPPPPQSQQGQQRQMDSPPPVLRPMGPGMGGGMMGGEMMTPGTMQMMGQMMGGPQGRGGRGQQSGAGNPLQMVSKLLAAL